jgi:hypothetical protein
MPCSGLFRGPLERKGVFFFGPFGGARFREKEWANVYRWNCVYLSFSVHAELVIAKPHQELKAAIVAGWRHGKKFP